MVQGSSGKYFVGASGKVSSSVISFLYSLNSFSSLTKLYEEVCLVVTL